MVESESDKQIRLQTIKELINSNIPEKEKQRYRKIQQSIEHPHFSRVHWKFISGGFLIFVLCACAVFALTPVNQVTSSNLVTLNGAGQLQSYDGTVPVTLSALTNAWIVNPTNGQIFTYNSTSGNWQNENPPASGNSYSMENLTDSDIVSPTNGDIAIYNGSAWVAQLPFSALWNATVNQLISDAAISTGQITSFASSVNSLISSASITTTQVTGLASYIGTYISNNPLAYSSLTGLPNLNNLPNSGVGPYSYLISTFTNATNTYYQALNGTNNQIVTGWTSIKYTNVFNNCTALGGNLYSSGAATVTATLDVSVAGTIVTFASGSLLTATVNLNTYLMYVTANNCHIINPQINGNGVNQGSPNTYNDVGIEITNCNDSYIDGGNIYGCALYGVWVLPNAVNDGVKNCVLTGNGIVSGTHYWAISLGGLPTSYVGIQTGLYVKDCDVSNSGDDDVGIYGQNCIIEGNYVHDSPTENTGGIVVEAGGNNTITANTITNCKEGIVVTAYHTSNTQSNTITANVISGCSNYGMEIATNENTITGNILTQGTGNTPSIRIEGSNNMLTGNTVNDTNAIDGGGVEVDGNDNQILGNTIALSNDEASNGIYISGNFNSVANNDIMGCENGGYGNTAIYVAVGAIDTNIGSNDINGNLVGGQTPILDYGTYTQYQATTQTVTDTGAVKGGMVLYDNAGTYTMANAVSSTAMNAVALACQNVTSGLVLVMTQGYFTNPNWSWTVGGSLYVSNSTAGALTQTLPTTSGNIDQYVGYAVSATEIWFCPDQITVGR